MLGGQQQARLAAAFTTALLALPQVVVTWRQAKAPNATATFEAAFRAAGAGDAEIINAYGEGTVLVVALASHFPVPPERFDEITCKAGRFTIVATHENIIGDRVLFYRIMARGK